MIHPKKLVSLATIGWLSISCHMFSGDMLIKRPHRGDSGNPEVDPINQRPVDESGDCSAVTGADAGGSLKLLTNAEYDLSVAALLGDGANASGKFPPDTMGTGFDTGSLRTFTTTLVQSYLDAGQTLGDWYVARNNADCQDQAYSSSCTANALENLAERAFRRPLLDGERARLRALPGSFAADGLSPREAYAASIASVLMAPQFLFRQTYTGYKVGATTDHYALASRLSFALWSSIPDAQLVSSAQSGALGDAGVQVSEISRLVSSPKALDSLRNFTDQWLGLRVLPKSPAAGHVDKELLAAFTSETQSFLADFLVHNRNIRHLVDARFTFVNAKLAKYYGVAGKFGDDMQYAEVDGDQRGGLLTQGAFLVQTSNPDGTSPVKRGKWILERLLCTPPAAPPPGVQSVLAPTDGTPKPMRQRLAAHRSSEACASCHQSMDPLGLGLENYDAYGKWRDRDDFGRIDASGKLPTGEVFANPVELAQVISETTEFPLCVTTKLAQYMLGRAPNRYERCMIDKIATRTKEESYGLKNLLVDLSRVLLTN